MDTQGLLDERQWCNASEHEQYLESTLRSYSGTLLESWCEIWEVHAQHFSGRWSSLYTSDICSFTFQTHLAMNMPKRKSQIHPINNLVNSAAPIQGTQHLAAVDVFGASGKIERMWRKEGWPARAYESCLRCLEIMGGVCWVQGPPIDPVGKRCIVLWRTIGRLWLFLKISVSDISAHFHWLLYWRFSLKSLQASRRQLRTYAWIPSMTLSHGLAWWRYSCCLLNWCHWECWYVAHLAAPWILKPFRFF